MPLKQSSENKEEDKNQGNIYDRIFRENAASIFMPLIENVLGLKVLSYKLEERAFPLTFERKVDFLYRVTAIQEEHANSPVETSHLKPTESMLHIEFEREVRKSMLRRMGLYHALILQEYELPVHQVVVNLEKGMAGVPTQLHPEEIYKGYDLVNIHQFDYNRLLQSQVPEMVILAILGHYGQERIEAVLRLIIKRLKAICHSEREMLKYLNQLTLLSRIRKFEKITKKTIQEMPITYDVKSDAFYIEGLAEGLAKGEARGEARGEAKGEAKEKLRVAEQCYINGLDVEMAVSISGLPKEKVLAIYEKLSQKD